MAKGRRNIDEMLALALACGATHEVAAQRVGVSKGTIKRRMREPEFRARLQQTRSDMVQRASGTLTAASTEAIKTLLTLQQPTTPHSTRLGAARSILEIGIKMRETADLEERLAALEEPDPKSYITAEQAMQIQHAWVNSAREAISDESIREAVARNPEAPARFLLIRWLELALKLMPGAGQKERQIEAKEIVDAIAIGQPGAADEPPTVPDEADLRAHCRNGRADSIQ